MSFPADKVTGDREIRRVTCRVSSDQLLLENSAS